MGGTLDCFGASTGEKREMFIEFHRYVPLDFLFDRSCIASLKEWGRMQPVGFQLPWPTLQGSLFRCRCEHRSFALPELQKSDAENDTLISGHCVNCRKYGHGTAKRCTLRQFWQSNIAKWSLAHLLAVKPGNCFFPTCQVRVVGFYQSCCPPPPPSPPPPPVSPRPCLHQLPPPLPPCQLFAKLFANFRAQCALLDLNLGPSQLSAHRWTSTWDLPSSVRAAGPQPGTCRAQCAPLDLNLGPS